MTSTVPGIIAWPLLTAMAALLLARYRWCTRSLYDTYFNNLMALMMLTNLLRERAVEALLSRAALLTATAAQQLGFVTMTLAGTEMIGFTMLWTGKSPEHTRRSHRRYRILAGAMSIAFLVAATPARVEGQTLESTRGWRTIAAWTFYLTMLMILAARLIWMFLAELFKRPPRPEFWLALGGLLLGVGDGAGSLGALGLAITDQLDWTHTVDSRKWFHGFEFFWFTVLVYVLGVVPLALKLRSHLGMDGTSRAWSQLQALRLSLTTIIPQSRINLEHDDPHPRKTTLQLHQTVIEIRDGLLQLRPYFRAVDPIELARFLKANGVAPDRHQAATLALQLAHAAIAKTEGAKPGPTSPALVARSRSTSLHEDAADLLALARWWPTAYTAATGRLTTAPPLKANNET